MRTPILALLAACGTPATTPTPENHAAAAPLDPDAVMTTLRTDLDAASHVCADRNAVASRYLPQLHALAHDPPRLAAERDHAWRAKAGTLAMGYAAMLDAPDCHGQSTEPIRAMVDVLADLATVPP